MSIQVFAFMPVEVFADSRLTLTQLRVLGVIYSFRSKDTNIAFPKREAIARRCGLSVTKISTATTALVKLGWLKKTGKGGFSRPVEYQVCFPETIPISGTVTDLGTVTEVGTTTVTESGTRTNGEQTSEQNNNYRSQSQTSRAHTFPDQLLPTEKNINLASELGLDPNLEFLKFRDHHQSKGSKFKDWNAAFNSWLRKAAEYASDRKKKNHRKSTPQNFSTIDYEEGSI
ncbi:helix-turn-helix domain-containing protein [Propionivibrio dicarboxylicus]|uniref:Phage replication protein O n=1 Tax=Propionivibrio dicarboxylicus TaxID=83767 RepID=A0A1G8FVS2_9RHOO|nr:helix-turn-helix domain-containing protein [Propionivibrio dicarboxylicus]SDH86253.1 phage replication protein O [Propionivibrio dicarboxylicus]